MTVCMPLCSTLAHSKTIQRNLSFLVFSVWCLFVVCFCLIFSTVLLLFVGNIFSILKSLSWNPCPVILVVDLTRRWVPSIVSWLSNYLCVPTLTEIDKNLLQSIFMHYGLNYSFQDSASGPLELYTKISDIAMIELFSKGWDFILSFLFPSIGVSF